MTALHVDRTVLDGYPDISIAVIGAWGVLSAPRWDDADEVLAGLESAVADGSWAPPTEADEAIASWHAVYRAFGTNPRRLRPSVDALCRRLSRTGRLPRINGPVDAYNGVSVRYGLPAGAFDLDAVRGDIQLRLAHDGDAFQPLGEPDVIEHPGGAEVVYADDVSVLTRHWNHRDADRTKVTPESKNIVFLLESATGAAGVPTLLAAAEALATVLAGRCQHLAQHLVGSAHAHSVPLRPAPPDVAAP